MQENKMLELILNEIKGIKHDVNNFKQEVNSKFEEVSSKFEEVNSRFDGVNSRFEEVNSRFDEVNSKFDNLQNQVDMIAIETVKTKIILENTTNKNINLLIDGYMSTSEKLENHEFRISKLEKVV